MYLRAAFALYYIAPFIIAPQRHTSKRTTLCLHSVDVAFLFVGVHFVH